MRVLEQNADVPAHHAELMRFAVELGADPAEAPEMVGAVFSFCRGRHGSTSLSEGYLRFLTARAVASASGVPLRREALAESPLSLAPAERMLVRALVQSADPADLYDMYRRAFLFVAATGLTSSGVALHLDLRRIAGTVASDHLLAWGAASRRIAGWVGDWRQGSPSLGLLLVYPAATGAMPESEHREYLAENVHAEELRRNLPACEIRWLAGVVG